MSETRRIGKIGSCFESSGFTRVNTESDRKHTLCYKIVEDKITVFCEKGMRWEMKHPQPTSILAQIKEFDLSEIEGDLPTMSTETKTTNKVAIQVS